MDNFIDKDKNDVTFLIVVDFSEPSYKALNYLIKLVKVVRGNIHVHCVAEPQDIMGSDNQIAALRSIDSHKKSIENKLNSIIEMIELEGINVKGSFSFGHLHSELEEQLNDTSPIAVVIGQMKSGVLGKATEYLLYQFQGNLLIVSDQSEFMTGANIAIGCSNKTLKISNLNLVSIYSRLTKTPLLLLEIGESTMEVSEFNTSNQLHEELVIQYKNDKRSNVIEGLKTFVETNNVELLCIGRTKNKGSLFGRIFKSRNTMVKMVGNSKVPLLIMANK